MKDNKSRRNGPSNPSSNYNPSPTNTVPNYLNETDTFFNESSFQPSAQSTYYQPPTPHQQKQQPPTNFYDSNQMNNNFKPMNHGGNSNFYNPNQNNMNFSVPAQPEQPPTTNGNSQMAQNSYMPNSQTQQQPSLYNPADVNRLFNDPMANMAVKYGSNFAVQGKDYVAQNVDRWFSISKLKYYFAVDTTYVYKKLLLILFPFINKDWSVKYSQDEAIPPKLDVNAPDLYIPIMSFVTYLLMVGVCLGIQEKFTPELLGIQASSALGWFIIEVFLIFIVMQILAIKSALKTFDIMSFCGYKYFGMIICLAGNLIMPGLGYTIALVYMCVSITYFMVRNLKLMILANENDQQQGSYQHGSVLTGNKRRIYFLLFISLLQPFFIWWLTRHLIAAA